MSKSLSKRKEKAVPSSIGSNVDKQPSKQTSSLQLVSPPSSSKTSQSNEYLLASPEKPIIAYVHNLSPIKRNKKNTIDYTTLTLQMSDNPKQLALCYSKNKRKILEEKETTRSPVKITRYTTSTDKTKIIFNDKTIVSAPQDLDYNFQFTSIDNTPATAIADILSADDESTENNITVCSKVVVMNQTKTVKLNKVAELIVRDKTSSIQLDLWNKQIGQVENKGIYCFINLSSTYWNNTKKLTTTYNTIIKPIVDKSLSELTCQDEDMKAVSTEQVIEVPSFVTMEDVQRYRTCINCNRRVPQGQTNIVKCDHCRHKMKWEDCPQKLCTNVIISINDHKKTLTIFEDCMKELLGEYDQAQVDVNLIGDQLLDLNNIKLTFNDRLIITSAKLM